MIYSPTGQIVGEWFNTTFGQQAFTSLTATPDSGFITVGKWGGLNAIAKFNSLGDTVWTRSTPIVSSLQSFSNAGISETNDSAYILAFSFSNGASEEIYVAKIDGQGDNLWTYQWGNSLYDEQSSDIIVTSDGGCLITGTYAIDQSNFEFNTFAIKLSSSGAKGFLPY